MNAITSCHKGSQDCHDQFHDPSHGFQPANHHPNLGASQITIAVFVRLDNNHMEGTIFRRAEAPSAMAINNNVIMSRDHPSDLTKGATSGKDLKLL